VLRLSTARFNRFNSEGVMSNVTKFYSYRVQWSEQDQEFVGLCAEFPRLSWLDEDQESAFKGIRRLVRETVENMEAHGEPIPEPIAKREFSGEFKVRIPPFVHRQLVLEAAENHVSLNRLVSSKLAR
jgi:predicted HicB family RNase H-like nuclease